MAAGRWLRRRRTPEEAFADEVARLVPRLLDVQRVEQGDDLTLHLTLADGGKATMFLHNLYGETSGVEPEVREERLRRAVLAMAPTDRPASWAEAAPKVLPAVRAASSAAAYTLGSVYPIRTVLVPFVVRLVAVDEEHGMSFVSNEDLQGWGVDRSTVEATAAENLRNGGAEVGVSPDSSWLEVLGPDGYASSWLAAPDAFDHLAAAIGTDYVVVARSRDSLRLISTSDGERLRHELELELDEFQTEVRGLSPVPYVVSDGALGVWDPPGGHPCRRVVERASLILAGTEYAYQHNVLDDLLEKAGEDVFVANLNMVERPDGSVWSWAAWVRQVTDGLVPRADYLGLGDNATDEIFWVDWDDAVRVAGHVLREEAGYYPPRWRVRGWPEGETLAELRRLAVDPSEDG